VPGGNAICIRTASAIPSRTPSHGDPADRCEWIHRLAPAAGAGGGVDVVVNAVGILRERSTQTFEALHETGPRTLFDACVAAGVRRVVHVSALGAGAGATSRYHLSKRAGDDALRALAIEGIVVQPSLVFGADGASARLFLAALATLPVLPLPAGGLQLVQPIHVDDLTAALVRLVLDGLPAMTEDRTVALAGPAPVTLARCLQALRAALGMPPARTVDMPATWVTAAATLGSRLASGPLDRDRWAMLRRGNTAPVEATCALLGGPPRPAERFIEPEDAADRRRLAQLRWLLPVLRLVYTAIITWRLPEYWIHPYGPVVKNLPMLAMQWLLDALGAEEGRA